MHGVSGDNERLIEYTCLGQSKEERISIITTYEWAFTLWIESEGKVESE